MKIMFDVVYQEMAKNYQITRALAITLRKHGIRGKLFALLLQLFSDPKDEFVVNICTTAISNFFIRNY